jgi:hypothetical protein
MSLQEGLHSVGKSRELGDPKPIDRPENAIREQRQSGVRRAYIAQQNGLV